MLVGTAHVKIVADVSKLAGDIERQLGRIDVSRIGQDLGDQVGRGLRDRVEAQFADLPDLLVDRASDFKAAGQLMGDEFGNGFMDKVKTHFDLLPDLVDGEEVGRQLADDASNGFAQNLNFEQAMRDQVRNAASAADGEAQSAGAQIVESMSNGMRSRPLDMDFDGAGRDGGNRYGAGFMSSFRDFMNTRDEAPFEGLIKGLLGNLIQLQVLQGIIVSVIGAISSLVSAVVMLSSALYYAAPAALKFGNALFAMAQGAIVAKGLFGGLGQAISSYTKVQGAAAKATNATAAATKKSVMDEEERLLRIREARDALNDAIIEGARKNEDAVERVSDAHESLEDAIEAVSDAEEALSDAIEGVSDAEEALSDAIRNEERALRSINEARKQAQERIEDLQMSLERSSLTEERAALNLKKAEKRLAEARAGGNANAIYEADLAYREQLQTLKEVRERNGDLRDEANKAFSEGVSGNQKVIDAQEAYLDAVERTSDAHEALADAQERVRDAQEGIRDATERVSDAQRELKRAMEDVPRVAEDVALRIARAQLNLKKALQGTDDAMGQSAKGLDTAVGNMNDSFAKLDPAAQKFVRFWVDRVLPIFERIKKAGQAEFFPKLQEAIEGLIDDARFIPMLEKAFVDTSNVLGDFALNLSAAFRTPETLDALETILESNTVILRNLADAASNLVQPLSQIFAATAPLAEEWSESIKEATERFKEFISEAAEGGEDSSLSKFFRDAQDIASRFWRILKNIGSGIGGVFEAALGPGKYLLGMLEKMTSEWAEKMNDPKNQEQMSKTFTGAATNAVALMGVLGDIIGVLFRLGANPAIGDLARSVEKALPAFEALANDSLEQVAGALGRIIEALPEFGEFFMETGTIKAFADTMATVVEGIGGFLSFLADLNKKFKDLTGINILGITGAILGFVAAMSLVIGVGGWSFNKIKKQFESVGKAAKATKDLVVGSFTKMWKATQGQLASRRAKKAYDSSAVFDGSWSKAGREQAGREAKQAVTGKGGDSKSGGRKEGQNIGEGMEQGLRDKLDDVATAATALARAAIEAIQTATQSQSPSKVAIREGRNVGEGFEIGLRGGMDDALSGGMALGDSAEAGLKASTETAGHQAGSEIARETAAGMRMGTPDVTAAAAQMGSSIDMALDASTEVTGTMAGSEIGRDMSMGMKAATPQVTAAAAQMGRSADLALDAATEVTGTMAGAEIGRDMAMALNASKPQVMAASAGLGSAAATGAATSAGKARGIFGGLGKGFSAIGRGVAAAFGPIFMIATMVIPLLMELYNSNEKFRESVQGALGKLMELASTVFEAIQPALTVIIDVFKSLAETLAPVFADLMATIGPLFAQLIEIIGPIIGELAGTFMTVFASLAEMLVPVIQQILPPLMDLVGILVSTLLPVFMELVPPIMALVSTLIDALMPVIMALLPPILELASVLLEALMPVVAMIVEVFGVLVAEVVKALMPALEILIPVVVELVDVFINEFLPSIIDMIPVIVEVAGAFVEIIKAIMPLAVTLIQALLPAIAPIIPIFAMLISTIAKLLIPIIKALLPVILTLAQIFVQQLLPAILPLLPVIIQVITIFLQLAAKIIAVVMPIITKLITLVIKILVPVIGSILKIVASVIAGVVKAFSKWFELWSNVFKFIREKWDQYGRPAIDKIKEGIQKVKDTVQSVVDSVKEKWNGIISAIQGPIETVVKGINNWLIKPVNSILDKLGIKLLPEISVNFNKKARGGMAGEGPGGYIRGPGGPTSDKIPTLLSNGEFVVRSRSVSKLPRGALEYINKTGKLPSGGGIDIIGAVKGVAGAIGGTVKDFLAKGAAFAIRKIFDAGIAIAKANEGNMIGDLVLGVLRTMKQRMSEWGSKRDDEAEPDSSTGSIPPYKGPADGWTYPLSKRFPSYTRPNHSPRWAYDIGSPTGIGVIAVSSGRVVTSANLGDRSYGQYIAIVHHDKSRSLYAHLSKRFVGVGQNVRAGERIGLSGNTGGSTGPHLHFELGFADAREMMRRRGVRLASGGTVRATPGGIDAVIGEGGRDERVTPLDSKGRSQTEVEMLAELKKLSELWASGGNGNVFQIFPAPGMSERELAIKVSREVAFRHRRRA